MTRVTIDYTESDMAVALVEELNLKGHDVFPEVQLEQGGPRADLVSVCNGVTHVWELKKNLNFTLLEQVFNWTQYQKGVPNYIHCVAASFGRSSTLKDAILKENRIGVLLFNPEWWKASLLTPRTEGAKDRIFREHYAHIPKIQPASRVLSKLLLEQLDPDMKNATPGTQSGKAYYSTPFKRTMNRVYHWLSEKPTGEEVHMSQVVEFLDSSGGHHYSSRNGAMNGIADALLRDGKSVEHLRYIID